MSRKYWAYEINGNRQIPAQAMGAVVSCCPCFSCARVSLADLRCRQPSLVNVTVKYGMADSTVPGLKLAIVTVFLGVSL